jgi:hypothetical protein
VGANQGSNPEAAAGGRELSESLAAITGVLLNEETLAAILQLFVSLCRSMIEGVDGSSVSLLRRHGTGSPGPLPALMGVPPIHT